MLRTRLTVVVPTSNASAIRATDEQLFEIMSVGLIVGGSIVIPHLRRAVALLYELNDKLPEDRAV